jgi:hypothetical protein
MSCSDPGLLNYLLEERGFIAFEEISDSIHVRLVPAVVSPVALSAFCYHLADRNPARIAIAWLDGVWKDGLFGSRRGAIRHLLNLIPQSRDRAGDFMSRPRSIDRLSPSSPLGFLASVWQTTCRPLAHEQFGQVLHDGLGGRYVVVQAGDDANIYFRAVGRGFPWLDERWVARSSGLRMQDQPDYHLGRWAAGAYRDVAGGGAPRLDDIDAITITPHLGRARIRYTRLIVPVETRCGRRCLLGASVIDPSIDLRA